MNCKKCGGPLRVGAGFCSQCGAPATAVAPEPEETSSIETKRCPKCGAENPAAAKFCRSDGYRFAEDAAEARSGIRLPEPPSVASPKPMVAPDSIDVAGVRCPNCGIINPPGSRYCRGDGVPLVRDTQSDPRLEPPPTPRGKWRDAAHGRSELTARSPRSWRPLVIGVSVVGLVVVLAGASYGYWIGLIGDRPGSVARAITEDLHKKGYDQVTVAMGKDWVASVAGSVVGQEQASAVEKALRGRADLKGLNLQALQVKPSVDEIRVAVRNALDQDQLANIAAEVNDNGQVVLSGRASLESDKDRAAEAVGRVQGVSSVDNRVQLPYVVLEREINRALSSAGYFGVHASVAGDDSVVVSGTIQAEQDRAMIVAKVVEAGAAIGEPLDSGLVKDDMILAAPVVEAAPPLPTEVDQSNRARASGTNTAYRECVARGNSESQCARMYGSAPQQTQGEAAARAGAATTSTPTAQDPQKIRAYQACLARGVSKESCTTLYLSTQAPGPSTAASPAATEAIADTAAREDSAAGGDLILGTWSGRFWSMLLPFEVTIQITSVVSGESAGQTVYTGAGRVVCRGALRLLKAENGEFTYEERKTAQFDACPIRGTLRLSAEQWDTALAKWYPSGAEGKPSHKAKLHRGR